MTTATAADPVKKIFDLSDRLCKVLGTIGERLDAVQAAQVEREQREANYQSKGLVTPQRQRRGGGWTPERRAKHAAAIRAWKPWEKSTGPRTAGGKARAAANNRFTHLRRQLAAALRRQQSLLRQFRREVNGLIKKLSTPKPAPAAMLNSSYEQARLNLAKSGIEQPGLEARRLFRHVLSVSDAALIAGDATPLTKDQQSRLDYALARRLKGEPLSRILGTREFWRLSFRVTDDVLDPRPDTETLVEAVVKTYAGQRPPEKILDLGTGSGCILIALLTEFPASQGIGIDISRRALRIAKENAKTNGVDARTRFLRSDWSKNFKHRYPLIVANPPYIESGIIPNLDIGVRHYDPLEALDGGPDGLDAYKRIIDLLPERLTEDGLCFFEIGQGQGAEIKHLCEKNGLRVLESWADPGGIERVLKIALGTK